MGNTTAKLTFQFSIPKGTGKALELKNIVESILKTQEGSVHLSTELDPSFLKEPFYNLVLAGRTRSRLFNLGVRTIEDITNLTAQELLSPHVFGKKSLEELRAKLRLHGIKLAGD